MRTALITGVTGQDGSYLAEWLVGHGYRVHGMVRPGSRVLLPTLPGVEFHPADLQDSAALRACVAKVRPDETYHLGGQSDVAHSFSNPASTLVINVMGTLNLLEAVRAERPDSRFFHAGTAQVFGEPDVEPQDESTPHRPVNPYGVSKAAAGDLVRIARDSGGFFAVNGILYNHESPRRGANFVTRKVCRAVAAIRAGRQKELVMGDLSARRDWGYAPDFVRGMWLTLQHPEPGDYVFATGELRSVEDLVAAAFGRVGLDWRDHVRQDRSFFRPQDCHHLVGNPAKARRVLGWVGTKGFEAMIAEMVDAELRTLSALPG